MAKLTRRVIVTTVRYEETEELTEQQIQNWKSEDDDLKQEVIDCFCKR